MSSTKPLLLLTVALCAGTLSACATAPKTERAEIPRAPTEQFMPSVAIEPQQLLLTPHAQGLSEAQRAAMADMAGRWTSSHGGPVVVETPGGAGPAVAQAASHVTEFLAGYGIGGASVSIRSYAADAQAPIRVTFPVYAANIPKCGQRWENLAKPTNEAAENYGCALSSNIAAMVANPADLAYPPAAGPPDAARREVVLEKYRAGAETSSINTASANSRAVQ